MPRSCQELIIYKSYILYVPGRETVRPEVLRVERERECGGRRTMLGEAVLWVEFCPE